MVKSALLALAIAAPAAAALAGELVVKVGDIPSAEGEVGCALFAGEAGFPTGASAVQEWTKADPAGVTCRFTGLETGDYAVAVSHDLNGNRITDTNFLGIPREDWGVSNNVRPTLRAPRFDEAKIRVVADRATEIDVSLGQ